MNRRACVVQPLDGSAFKAEIESPDRRRRRYVYFAACGCLCWRWTERCCRHGARGEAGAIGDTPCGLCKVREKRATEGR